MAEVRVTEGRLVAPSGGSEITTALAVPDDAIALMMLGHGSGTPIYSPVMVQMVEALADQRIATFRYNYPYSEGMTIYSPDKIDPIEVLLATTSLAKNAVADLSLDLPLFLGGRSMSGQVVSLALTRELWPDVRGLVLYVFPMRWHNLLEDPISHLNQVPVPMLFVQGDRDLELTDLEEFQSVMDELGNRTTLHVVEGANHSYDLPAGSNRTRLDALSEVASATATWILRHLR